jgi:predicted RNA-binding protein YlqC (UPF0109 family)
MNEDKHDDKEFLEFVVKTLVDNPDEVKVERKVDEMGVLLTLSVKQEDMGKIIGRSGNTAKAIRTLLRVVGMKNNARVNLKIDEPEGSTFVRNDNQDDNESQIDNSDDLDNDSSPIAEDNDSDVDSIIEDLKNE